jgi:hypothetical protein
MNVKATLVDDIDSVRATPGAFEFFVKERGGPPAGILYSCPCGCARVGALNFRPAPSPSWDWDGNREAPTLSPSVHDMPDGVTHWHGWLRAGTWESC